MAFPGNFPITHYRGDTFRESFVYQTAIAFDAGGNPTDLEPVDMTGGELLAQIRQSTELDATVLATFIVENFIPATGSWDLYLAPETTATADWTQGFYDVQFIDSNGVVQTLYFGSFDMTPDVSRA